MRKLVLLLIVAAFVAGTVWAFRTLPWWALVLGFVVLVIVGKFAAKRVLKRLFLVPFKLKGGVLHGATIQVHSVVPSEAPTKTDASESEVPDVRRRYFTFDVTIQPQQATGKFRHWEPGELLLTRTTFRFDPNKDDSKMDDACRISELQYEQDGAFKADEGFKFEGPMRLKMTLAVRESVHKLKFQYYFEQFGEIYLPDAGAHSSAFEAAA
jgi:hypothetical protein